MSEIIGQKIKEARRRTGLSQDEFGYKIDVTRQTVSKWELNESTPRSDHLNRIYEVFGFPADYFLGDYGVDELDKAVAIDKSKQSYGFAFACSSDTVRRKTDRLLTNVLLAVTLLILSAIIALLVLALLGFLLVS